MVVAEWSSKRANTQLNLRGGKNIVDLTLGPIHLGPSQYELAFVLNDSTGVYLPYWSLKQHTLTVKGTIVGASKYQLPQSRVHISES